MVFSEINPHIRFAQSFCYRGTGEEVFVRDCRLFYIEEGQGRITVGERQYRLAPGALFYCAAGSRYAVTADAVTMTVLNFDLTQRKRTQTEMRPLLLVRETSVLPQAERDTVEDCAWLGDHLFLPRGESQAAELARILEEFADRRVGYRDAAGGILKTVLTAMHRAGLTESDEAADTVTRLIAYIRAHCGEPLNNGTLSAMSGYHAVHLNRLFVRHAGTTIHRYVLSVRLDAARRMLLSTDLPLSEIAERAGFGSAAHFSACFRQASGISPTQFRREAGR